MKYYQRHVLVSEDTMTMETDDWYLVVSILVQLEEALRWEEGKKWQRTIDKMKSKIKEKDDEIEKLSHSLERMKVTLER